MNTVTRAFIPGSNWLYYKIYTGDRVADVLLSNQLHKAITRLEKHYIKFFYIRYADPEFHIRLRFLLRNAEALTPIMFEINKTLQPLVKDKTVWKVQIDTYNRELERYLPHLIEEAESVFHIDSKYSLKILGTLNTAGVEKYRWMAAFKMIDCLLDDFRLSLKQKSKLLEAMDNAYKNEFGFNMHNSTQFNVEYRKHTPDINAVMNETTDKAFCKIYGLLKSKSKEMQPIAERIIRMAKPDELGSLLMSYIHMMLNRHFISANRKYELLIYNFLNRYYAGCIARIKYNKHNL